MVNPDAMGIEEPRHAPESERGEGPDRQRRGSIVALASALAIQGVSGIAGGFGLIADPTGRALGIPIEWLAGSPFPDFMVPGVVLLTVLGIGPLFASYGVWTRRSWSGWAALAVGLSLVIWLAVEIAIIGYQSEPPLQAIYGVLAAVILVLVMLPSSRHALLR